MSLPQPCSCISSNEDIEDKEVLDGDCLGVSLGDPAAVEGAESAVVEVTVLRRTVRAGIEVEAIVGVLF
jgi:hypothetical protein